jgi:hypothetical protein
MAKFYTMTENQYNSFSSSKFIKMMYEDKMAIESVQRQENGDYKVTPSEGIDLNFYSDIYIPFMMWYNCRAIEVEILN